MSRVSDSFGSDFLLSVFTALKDSEELVGKSVDNF